MHRECIPLNREEFHGQKLSSTQWICTLCTGNIFPFNHLLDDDEFTSELSEYYKDLSQLHLDLNDTQMFNVFEMNDMNDSDFLPLFSYDPDMNFYNDYARNINGDSKYYSIDSFNKALETVFSDVPTLSLCHINIRSLPAHLVEFDALLSTMNISFDVIAITETWLNAENADLYNLVGYDYVHKYRSGTKGGGVSMLVKKSFNFTHRNDISIFNNDIETVFIEIDKTLIGEKNIFVIGSIYRPHTDCEGFMDSMQTIFDTLKRENKICYFLGDFNFDLFKHEIHKRTSDFLDHMYSQACFPLIKRPTRITENTATLIDNIFTNTYDSKSKALSGIYPTTISDHYLIWHISQIQESPKPPTYMLKRKFNEEAKNIFLQKLQEIKWDNILSNSDTQDAFSKFHDIYRNAFETSFPIIKVNFQYNNRKPWLLKSLQNSIKQKNKLYVKSLRCPTLSNEKAYKEYKKVLTKTLIVAEKSHVQNLFESSKSNLGKSWKIIKSVLNKSHTKNIQRTFSANGKLITDKKEIAENFNDFFVNIGPTLSNKIPFTEGNIQDYLTRAQNRILLSPVDKAEITEVIKNLKDSSSGWDEIDASMLKLSLNSIIAPFKHICNLSLLNGIFPKELKIARVCPIFKNGNPMHFVQYRPVSVLPVMSKVLEKIMYNRVYTFLQDLELLYEFQFGFRPKHSTELALMLSVDKIISALDRNNFVLGIFLDFSKAFDTIDHAILLQKLDNYGIRGIANEWFRSYLTDRYQYVCYDGTNSTYRKIVCGVPQGSILGPLLFLIYINDLASICNEILPVMYADDSNLFAEGSDMEVLQNTMNREMVKVSRWLKLNRLSLNIDKTHFMIFKRRRQHIGFVPKIHIDSHPIHQVSNTKFLGVYIDEHLTWQTHINYIAGKVSRGTGILKKAKKYLNKSTLHLLYYTFIYPYLGYCNIIWGNTYSTYLTKLLVLQKKIVRLIANIKFRDNISTSTYFKELRILKCREIYKYQVGQFIYKHKQNVFPSLFNYLFHTSTHEYFTRISHRYVAHRYSIELTRRSLRHEGIHFWNTICDTIGICTTVDTFKFCLKRYLLEIQE